MTIKEKRLEMKLGLRMFCSILNLDPAFWSRVERGLEPIPEELMPQIQALLKETVFDPLEKKEETILDELPAFFHHKK